MNKDTYFLHQIKHNKATDVWDKGIVVKANVEDNNWDAVRQSYHAYLGAYAYGHDANTDFVQCEITGLDGVRLMWENWKAKEEPEPEPEPEEPEDEGDEEPEVEPTPEPENGGEG